MALAMAGGVMQFFVSVNYNMVEYLPDDAPSTKALDIMEEEFEASVPNTRVMVKDVSVQEALVYKEQLENIDGVNDVTWLDDVMDLKIPLEMADDETVESYYKDRHALYSFTVTSGHEVEATDAIYEVIGEENALTGEALDTAISQKMAGTETMYAAALLVPIIIIILIVSTTSWLEPVFFLVAIGVSILINLGTTIFIGEISFVTQSVSPILQLAVSLDYAIFLLHSFSDSRKEASSPEEAMYLAMKRSFPAITASAATTFFGFMALTFMNFEIGSDLGLNLVKGILFSFISVMVFLPALTLCFYKWIDKTHHKQLIPAFKGIGKGVVKMRYVSLFIVAIVMVPSFLAQSHTTFTYGLGEQPDTTRAGSDFVAVEDTFGELTPIVLLVPKGDTAREAELGNDLEQLPNVTSVISYATAISPVIPSDYLEESLTEQFLSENYSRVVINTDLGAEGEHPFALVEKVEDVSRSYYGGEALLLGESVTLYDMKTIVTKDNSLVNMLTVGTIAIVLIITFRSLSFPVVLLLTIQVAVWINLSMPYYTNTPLDFVGYLIVSTVQLAATVDYAILFTENYREKRTEMSAFKAIKHTLDHKTFSIVVSASILSSVGFILWMTSSNQIVSSIGLLLGRGALLAFLMVLFFLPASLVIFDKLIEKTTWKANFFKGK